MSNELQHVEDIWRGRAIRGAIFVAILAAILLYLYQQIGSVQLFSLPKGSVELSMPYTKYLQGESIQITVTNNFNTPITILNDCPYEPLAVYKYVSKKWQRIHSLSKTRVCDDDDKTVLIKPNTSVTTSFKEWPDLFSKSGKYRIALQVHYYGYIPYKDFEIVKKTKVNVAAKDTTTTKTGVRQAKPSTTKTGTSQEDDA